MNKWMKILMIISLVVNCVLMSVGASAEEKEYADVIRIMGETRYETCLEISDTLKQVLRIEKFDTVILSSGENYADALVGSYLAAVKTAPIIIVNPEAKNFDDIKAYLDANLVSGGKVYILGGTAAVPFKIESALTGYTIHRLAGSDRFETNLLILEEAAVTDEPILVCYGRNYADSLSASSTGLPMLLVEKNKLNAEQKAFLEAHKGNQIYVVGGTSVVEQSVEKELKNYGPVERISGASRYDTSIEIAKRFFPDADRAVLAYAQNYPDGLCGGPLAYAMKSPLILTDTKNVKKTARYTEAYDTSYGAVLGGSGLISDKACKQIFGTLPVKGALLKPMNTMIEISYLTLADLENNVVHGNASATKSKIHSFLVNKLGFSEMPNIQICVADEIAGTILDTGNFEVGTYPLDTVFTITISGGPNE